MTEPSLPEESIFAQALEIESATERAAFLDRACSGNPALRAEVEALLRAHERSCDLLDIPEYVPVTTVPPASEGAGNVPATVAPPIHEGPGMVLGRYKLLEQIGEGGMGSVWMAEQTEPIERRVAVKVVREGLDSFKQVLARFEAERQALALMEHPNIARVLDAGQTLWGRPYFVMELVKGQPITQYCDEKRLGVRGRLELFVDVCRAVQHAHQKGIIHRDLKPSNVLVAPYDGEPVVKVIDFGVAKATGQRLTDKTLFTGFGALVGTPEYMSPEQAEANNLDIDTRSDIYSLGVLLYELLTGSTPLTRQRLQESPLLEVLRVIREEEPPTPSTRLSTTHELPSIAANRGLEPRKLTTLVRGELDWIVMKALEKSRNRRYETANDFALDLERYLADEPVQACPPSVRYRLQKFMRRNQGPVLAVSIIVVLLIAGIVGTTLGLFQALAAERRTVKERDEKDEAWRQTRRALNTMTDEVVADLQGAQVQLTDRNREFLRKALDYHTGFAVAKANDPEGRHSRAEGFFRVGEIRLYLGELPEAETAFREAIALQKELAAEFPDRRDIRRELGQSYHNLGMLLWPIDRREEAEEAEREAIALARQLTAESNEPQYRQDLAKSEASLGAYFFKALRFEEAEEHFREALAIALQLAHDCPDVADYHHEVFLNYYDVGFLLSATNRPEEAEKVCKEAEALARELIPRFRTLPEFRQDLGDTYAFMGVLLQSTHRPDDAEKAWRQARSIFKELAAEFPARPYFRLKLAAADNNLGKLLVNSTRLKEAEEVWGEHLALCKQLAAEIQVRPEFRLQVALGYHNLAALLHLTHRQKEAEEVWRKAVEIGKDLVQKNPKQTSYLDLLVMSSGHLALQIYESGKLAEGEKAWREVLELSKPVTHDEAMSETYCKLGEAQEAMPGRQEQTIAAYREAIRLSSTNAQAHSGLANALKASGHPDEAIIEFREAIRIGKDFPEAHVNLGNVLLDRKALDDAIAEFREALRTKHKFPEAYKAHNGLGNALRAKGRPEEAITEYQTAIRLNKNFAEAHYGLGNAFFPHRLEEAITEYHEAIRINKNYAEAHTNLGNSLAVKGDLDGAIREYRTALGINKDLFEAHLNFGFALMVAGQPDDALTECREALRLKNDSSAHDHLGFALQGKGRLHEAMAEYREAIRLENHNAEAREHLHHAEQLIQLQRRLRGMLQGNDSSKDAGELLGFADLCRRPYGEQYAAAATFFAAAFAADPKLAADMPTPHRPQAACTAALAGCGKGKDADKLDDKELARLRRQALAWLRAELDAWGRVLDDVPDQARPILLREVRHWLEDPDFAGVRDSEALAKLPEAERQPWQKLWNDAAGLLKRAQAKAPQEKKADKN
jgi:serine/threonine protein kinase/Flp pilus assembly protein TadD